MGLGGSRRGPRLGLLVAILSVGVAVSGCSGSSGPAPGRVSGPVTAATGPVRLTFPATLDDAGRAAALDGVQARLRRFGSDARVARTGGAITITPRPDPYVVEALARRDATTLATVIDRRPGACRGPGTDAPSPSPTCVSLGPTVAATSAVQSAEVTRHGLDGFGVDVTIGSAGWPAWRDALQPHLGGELAMVSGPEVIADLRISVMALQTRIGGQLREQDARRVAAALLIDSSLPAALGAPRVPAQIGARPGEVWTDSLAVNVCGRWLPPAPAFVGETGVHSHQDGLVYVHSLPSSAVGRRLTLGQFLAKGKWTMTRDHLALWSGVDVRAGDACAGSRDTTVTWSIDGVERHGAPADATLVPGRRFVVMFGAPGASVGDAPVVGELPRTTWAPRRTS
jgi:hypothetical protein